MFVRFVVETLDPRSGRKQGLFSATAALRDSGRLGDDDDHRLELLWSWFNKNLERPKRLSLSSRHNKRPQAISWFKETALEHIEQRHVVERITAERIGYILYKDEFLAAAHPFKDTPT
jgi:hypothetical protein